MNIFTWSDLTRYFKFTGSVSPKGSITPIKHWGSELLNEIYKEEQDSSRDKGNENYPLGGMLETYDIEREK